MVLAVNDQRRPSLQQKNCQGSNWHEISGMGRTDVCDSRMKKNPERRLRTRSSVAAPARFDARSVTADGGIRGPHTRCGLCNVNHGRRVAARLSTARTLSTGNMRTRGCAAGPLHRCGPVLDSERGSCVPLGRTGTNIHSESAGRGNWIAVGHARTYLLVVRCVRSSTRRGPPVIIVPDREGEAPCAC